jgi:hypothetical protein
MTLLEIAVIFAIAVVASLLIGESAWHENLGRCSVLKEECPRSGFMYLDIFKAICWMSIPWFGSFDSKIVDSKVFRSSRFILAALPSQPYPLSMTKDLRSSYFGPCLEETRRCFALGN